MNRFNHLSAWNLFFFAFIFLVISSLLQAGCGGGSKDEPLSKSESSLDSSPDIIQSKIILGEYTSGMMAPSSVTVPANVQSVQLEVFLDGQPSPFFSSIQNISSSNTTIEFNVDINVGQTYTFKANGYSLPNGPLGGGVVTHSGMNSGVTVTSNLVSIIVPLAQTSTFTTAPTISNLPIVSTNTTATITGLANPQGSETIVYFEWGMTAAATLTRTPIINIGSGVNPVPVTYTLTGLNPNTSYFFNMVAEKSGHIVNQNNLFTTPLVASANITFPKPPTIASTNASGITSTGAQLNASLLPGGSETLVYFEVGASAGVYNITTSSVIRITDLLWDNHSVSVPVTGLTAGTNYYYRVTAFNSESSGVTTITGIFTTP